METRDDTQPATEEDMKATFKSSEWQKLKVLIDETEQQMEAMNLVPLNKGGEQYIRDRYPIAVLYHRAYLQDVAMTECNTMLTEEEIQNIGCSFFDDFPDEIWLAIIEAVKLVVSERNSS